MSKREQRPRRYFSAEFKVEAVRLMRERRAAGVPLSQVSRELDLRAEMLRGWAQELDAQPAGASVTAAFPGRRSCGGCSATMRGCSRRWSS